MIVIPIVSSYQLGMMSLGIHATSDYISVLSSSRFQKEPFGLSSTFFFFFLLMFIWNLCSSLKIDFLR
jgi:hypothetical protein